MRFSIDAILASRFVPIRFRAGGNLERHGPDISTGGSVTGTKEAELTARLARFARVSAAEIFE